MTQTFINLNQVPTEPSLSDLLNLLKKEIFLDLNCHHLATIQEFDSVTQTVTATINYTKTFFTLNENTGTYNPTQVNYPIIADCPVVILGGGSASLTFPIAKGDECLLLFNDRDLDNWYLSGQVGPVATPRAHSFSDAIALVGVRSSQNSLDNYDETRAVLQNGTTMVGVSQTKVKVANNSYTLNTILQNILTQLQTLANTTAVNGSPINPSVATQLSTLATQLGSLLE